MRQNAEFLNLIEDDCRVSNL